MGMISSLKMTAAKAKKVMSINPWLIRAIDRMETTEMPQTDMTMMGMISSLKMTVTVAAETVLRMNTTSHMVVMKAIANDTLTENSAAPAETVLRMNTTS